MKNRRITIKTKDKEEKNECKANRNKQKNYSVSDVDK